MKQFSIAFPKDLDEAAALLPSKRGPAGPRDARVLAGGQDLLTEMKDHLVEPETLVALRSIPGLERTVPHALPRDEKGWAWFQRDAQRSEMQSGFRIGALVTLAEIAKRPGIRQQWPVLSEAAESVASPQIRTQATVGGNLCQRPRCWYYRNDQAPCIKKGGSECFAFGGRNKYSAILGGGPSYIVHPSDLATALVCLDATVVCAGRSDSKAVPIESFFTLPSEGSVQRENVLRANEIVTHVEVPYLFWGWKSTYLKFRERESFDFALASVALATREEGDKIAEAKLVLGGVAPIPWRAAKAEAFLAGKSNTPATWKQAAELALEGAEPLEQNGYKIPLTKGLIQKAFRKLA